MVSAATREAMDTTRYFVSLEFVFRLMSASLDRGFLPALVREMTFAPDALRFGCCPPRSGSCRNG